MAEVNIEALAVTEVWVGATTVEHDLRHTLLDDLKVLRPESQEKRDGKEKTERGKNTSFYFI